MPGTLHTAQRQIFASYVTQKLLFLIRADILRYAIYHSQWGIKSLGAEVIREALIPLNIIAPNKVVSASSNIYTNSSNPSGINFPVSYIYYGYSNNEIMVVTDVMMEADVYKPLKVSWIAICV